jgi:uncharacterized membrane-anchored protein
MKTRYLIAAATLQVCVLGFMAGEREWIRRYGQTIYLRTAPIDPRDVMRGDYVKLDYEVSRVPKALWRGAQLPVGEADSGRKEDLPVYAWLDAGTDGVASLVALSDRKPPQGMFLRGRLDNRSTPAALQVRYGLEAYFMEQGRAADVEETRRRDGIQVPLEMEVAVSSAGVGVIRGHRSSPLGIGLDLTNSPAPQTNRLSETRVKAATVRLLNASTQELAIVDLPGARSLALAVDETWQPSPVVWVHAGEPLPKPETTNVITLRPGQVHAIRVDFGDPYWAVAGTNRQPANADRPRAIGELDPWSARFRLVYRSPDEAAIRELPNGQRLWHGRLPTRAFSPVGRVD